MSVDTYFLAHTHSTQSRDQANRFLFLQKVKLSMSEPESLVFDRKVCKQLVNISVFSFNPHRFFFSFPLTTHKKSILVIVQLHYVNTKDAKCDTKCWQKTI